MAIAPSPDTKWFLRPLGKRWLNRTSPAWALKQPETELFVALFNVRVTKKKHTGSTCCNSCGLVGSDNIIISRCSHFGFCCLHHALVREQRTASVLCGASFRVVLWWGRHLFPFQKLIIFK